MDALAGYGSDSDSNEEDKPVPSVGALSGLLANYSDDDSNGDDDSAVVNGNKDGFSDDKKNGDDSMTLQSDRPGSLASLAAYALEDTPAKKRMRRWDNPNDGTDTNNNDQHIENDVLPPPRLLSTATVSSILKTEDDPFQSLLLFSKDYTMKLRQSLSQQVKSQTNNPSQGTRQLAQKLEQMHSTIQQQNETTISSSFATHLKSKHEFGNPHLLKNIIDHFQINPLESHVGNDFEKFEYVERLMVAEEKSRIAAATYGAGVGSGGGGGI